MAWHELYIRCPQSLYVRLVRVFASALACADSDAERELESLLVTVCRRLAGAPDVVAFLLAGGGAVKRVRSTAARGSGETP